MAGTLGAVAEGIEIRDGVIPHYKDWLMLKERLETCIREGLARQIQPPTGIDDGGYEWYLDVATGDIYCYGSPNLPTLPEWKKFDIQTQTVPEPKNFVQGLNGIPKGSMRLMEAKNLQMVLGFMVADGRVEVINPRGSSPVLNAKETWYRDKQSGRVYRLIEKLSEEGALWEQVPEEEIRGTIQ